MRTQCLDPIPIQICLMELGGHNEGLEGFSAGEVGNRYGGDSVAAFVPLAPLFASSAAVSRPMPL